MIRTISSMSSIPQRKGLKDHLEETTKQVGRLDQVFRMLGQEPKSVKCPAIDGLIEEADDLAGEVADKQVLDAAIVGSPKRSNITRSPATGS